MNFGGSWAAPKAPQPTSGLVLKCHFAEGKDPWPWFRCKNTDGSCKIKEFRLFFLVFQPPQRCPAGEFFMQSLGVQRASLIHSSAPAHISSTMAGLML